MIEKINTEEKRGHMHFTEQLLKEYVSSETIWQGKKITNFH